MNILVINDNSNNIFSETKNLATKLNENNEYTLYDLDYFSKMIKNYNLPVVEIISNILFSEKNVIMNIESIEMIKDNIYINYIINSTNTVVLNYTKEKFSKNDIMLKHSDFIIDIKEKISKQIASMESKNELFIAAKVVNNNGMFLFNSEIKNTSQLCLIPGSPTQPILYSEFCKLLATVDNQKFYKNILSGNVVFVREYSPVHELISKIFEKKVK